MSRKTDGIAIHRPPKSIVVASLVVRNLDQRLVDTLKQRGAMEGRSAEAPRVWHPSGVI